MYKRQNIHPNVIKPLIFDKETNQNADGIALISRSINVIEIVKVSNKNEK